MRLTVFSFLTAATCAFAAAAQTDASAHSFSLQDDGVSLQGNPGGLAFVRGLELDVLNHGYFDDRQGDSYALLFTGGAGPLSLGAGWDFWRSQTAVSLGGALRLGELGLGAVHRWFYLVDGTRVSSWDFGALWRPFSFLSLGAAALQANRPSSQPRSWQLSVGVRPLEDLIELAGDFRYMECAYSAPPCGLDSGNVLLTGKVNIVRGIRLLGQVGFLTGGAHTQLVGLELDLPHVGASFAPRATPNAGNEYFWRARFSTERWPAAPHLPGKHAVMIDLDKALKRPTPGPLALVIPFSARDPLSQTVAALRRLALDPAYDAVVFKASNLPIGLGKAEELQEAIRVLQAMDKKVIFYLESAGDLEYSVASSADRIYAAPEAVLLVNGFSASTLFAGAGLDKLGVKAEFFRVGAYKNAPDLFTRSSMSGEQREVQGSLLDDTYGRYLKRVAANRHLDESKLKDLLDKGILKPTEAVEAGLLDGLLYPDQLDEETGKLLGGKVTLEKSSVEEPTERETRWGSRPRIVVVRVEGDILRGEGQRDPFGAVRIAGSEPIARRIRRAADDRDVAAIVVRIDSPGGDGNASDLIWRELVRARKEKKKPVIASMGDVAASGGYYVAAGADEIWAEPSTITGSIGVFVGHFDAEELLGKLGLNLTTVKRGASADLFSVSRDLTDAERQTLQSWVDGFYDQFLDRVAEGRRLAKPEVDAIARGRVWTGAQAQVRKLVDHLGGLEGAIAAAKERAELSGDVEIDDEINARADLDQFAPGLSALSGFPASLAPRALRALHLLGEPGTLRASLPFDLEIH